MTTETTTETTMKIETRISTDRTDRTDRINTRSRAYRAGYREGLAWDLDGYASRAELRARRGGCGWSTTSINSGFTDPWLTEPWGTDAWYRQLAEYDAGCDAGACAPQSRRTGLPPGAERGADGRWVLPGEMAERSAMIFAEEDAAIAAERAAEWKTGEDRRNTADASAVARAEEVAP